jgi:ClpP class serine protease
MPLDLVLRTPGGLVPAATQIARAMSKHKAKVTVFVRHYAMSGGTLIALATDEIVMCELAGRAQHGGEGGDWMRG